MRPVAALRSVSPARPGSRDPEPGSLSKGGCYGLDPVAIADPGRSYEAVRTRNSPWILPDPWTTLKGASPTGPWTAHTTRRPQAPQALLRVSLAE